MKVFRILGKNISDSFKSVFRNSSLSLASISCITITLILVAFSIILSYNINSFTSEIEKDLTIVVFLDRDVTQTEIDKVESQIKSMNNVETLKSYSKEENKRKMQNKSEELDSIMKGWDDGYNPLFDTIHILVRDIDEIGNTAREIKSLEKVNIVEYGEGMVEELVKIFTNVKNITYVVVVSLVLITAFLISNTIKVTIASRKRQIEIMRLVGASNTYIKIPFFFEGLLLGILGSLIPIFFSCYGYIYLYEKFGGKIFTEIIKLVHPSSIIYIIIISVLGIGIVVGAFGSYRAVKRYLKI